MANKHQPSWIEPFIYLFVIVLGLFFLIFGLFHGNFEHLK